MVSIQIHPAGRRTIPVAIAFALASICGAACEDERPPVFQSDGGPVADTDAGAMGDAMPDTADAGPIDPMGPVVEVLAPVAPAPGDFTADAIITDTRFTVLCRAEQSPDSDDLVDSQSVTAYAVQGGLVAEAPAVATGANDEYQAEMAIEGFTNGPIDIRCSASDRAEPPRTNVASISTFLDNGPRIQVLVPAADDSFSQQLEVMIAVTAEPVDSADTDLSVVDPASVMLSLAGADFTNLTQTGDTFTMAVAFDDPGFAEPLLGEQNLRTLAGNVRGITREVDTPFNVDADGPVIEVLAPNAGDLVAGIMRLRVSVDDPVGIQLGSVIATVAGDQQVELSYDSDDDEYLGMFDTRILVNMVFPTVVVRARDALGNQSSFGMVVALDNRSPLVTLDSPPVREARYDQGTLECSVLFDPLGDDAANDGQGLTQLSELRARAEDRSNIANTSSSVIVPLAGVQPSSVDLFILDDSDGALVVDTDGDGICDDINPKLTPTSTPMADNEVVRLDMAPIPNRGGVYFGGSVGDPMVDPLAGPDAACNPEPNPAQQPPDPLCSLQSSLTWAMPDAIGENAIYTIPPVDSAGGQCLGNAFDSVAARISDGWACATARVEDRLGNFNIARPLRVCFDQDEDGAEGCPAVGAIETGMLPDCTGTYDPMTDTVDAAANCAFSSDPLDNFLPQQIRFK